MNVNNLQRPVYWVPEIYAVVIEQAREKNMSVSQYVNWLVTEQAKRLHTQRRKERTNAS